MSWIDDLARWAAGPDDDTPPLAAPGVSRRSALAVFGATAAALATGTLGDPEDAEAIVRCCDPNNNGTWSCPDGTECCCYTIPGGGGGNECCSGGKTCQALPGQFNHGVQMVGCCFAVCANDCCSTPDQFCDSQGYCTSCGDLQRCGDGCCDAGYDCVDGKCTLKCPAGQASCGDVCCATDEECFAGGCLTRCETNAVRCGANHACCQPGQACENDVLRDCHRRRRSAAMPAAARPSTAATRAAASAALHPRAAATPTRPACARTTRACAAATAADRASTAPATRAPPVRRAPRSAAVAAARPVDLQVRRLLGFDRLQGSLRVRQRGLLCGDKCCAKNDICLDGACVPCAPTSDACTDHCCPAPFVCNADACVCPEHSEACAGGCCGPDDECVGGRCLPKCDYAESSGRCGDVCCPVDELCLNGTCQTCPADTTTCGPVCCPAGKISFASGICRTPQAAPAKVTPPKTVTVEHGTATITVSCTGGCSGTVTLETVAAHGSVLALLSAKPRRLVLGKAKFRVPAGRKSARVHVHLSAAGKRYLAKHHGRLKAQALVKTTGVKTSFLSRAFTLKAGRKR